MGIWLVALGTHTIPRLVAYIFQGWDLYPPRAGGDLTRFAHHGGQQLGDDGAPLPHLALLAVREIGHYAGDAVGTGSAAGVYHDQQLHDGRVHVPGVAATSAG